MSQNFYGRVDQVAGKKIINISVNLKNNEIDINKISHERILQIINHLKNENKTINKMRYFNFPCFAILLISLAMISISLFSLHELALTNTSNYEPLFSQNSVFIIVILSAFLFFFFAKSLYDRTKYLHPILVENNKIIYELELEIQRRELRGQN